MTIIGQDTFVRANQSGWGTASDGQVWTHTVGTSTLAIASNEGTSTNDNSLVQLMTLGSTSQLDTDVVVRFKWTANASVNAGIFLRAGGSNAANHYRCRYNGGNIGLRRLIGGVSTTLGTDTTFAALSIGAFYWIRLRATSATITTKIWADGSPEPLAWTQTVVDTSIKEAGGFGIYSQINNIIDTISFDSFTATDTLSTAPYPRYVPRGLGATIIPDVVTQPLAYVDRGMSSTIIYEGRTFIPRALGGVYLPDTIVPTPRALGGTLTDAITGGATDNTSSFTDALAASESLFVVDSALPLDALVTIDVPLSSDGSMYTEANAASESLSGSGTGSFTDSLTTSDSFFKADSYLPTEATTISESLLEADGSLYTEANSASETLSGGRTGTFTDSLSTSESLLKADSYIPLDILTVNDASLSGGAFIPPESLSGISTPLDWDIYQPSDDALSTVDASTMAQTSPGGATNTTYSFTDALVAVDIFHRPTIYFANPGDNLQTKAAALLPGDTLYLNNGTYTGTKLLLHKIFGSLASPITIAAVNDGQAILDGGGTVDIVFLEYCSYINLYGFKAQNSLDTVVSLFQYNDHITVQRLTATGAGAGNHQVFFIGNGSTACNYEDCAGWGRGRYIFQAYHSNNVTFRRCFAYQPWQHQVDFPDAPRVGFGVYGDYNVLLENCVAYNVLPFETDFNYYAAAWDTSDDLTNHPNSNINYKGCIFHHVSSGMTTPNAVNSDGTSLVENCVFYVPDNASAATYQTTRYNGQAMAFGNANANGTVNKVTFAGGKDGVSIDGTQPNTLTLKNSVFYNNSGACSLNFAPNSHIYNDYSGNGSVGFTLSGSEITTTPTYNTATYGIGAYLIPPSNLHTLGESGTNMGAEVLYCYQDGALTNLPLWPWPMEGRIQAELGVSVTYESGGGLWRTLAGVYPEWTEAYIATDSFTATNSYIPLEANTTSEKILVGGPAMFVEAGQVSDTARIVAVTSAILLYLSATWLTRDMNATWQTRSDGVTWTTRDGKATWRTRDEQIIWDTRDELVAAWKARS